jgi:hypothetical protein
MKTLIKRKLSLACAAGLGVLLFQGATTWAATINLIASDPYNGGDSFISGPTFNWSDGLAPSAGNDYVAGGSYNLMTPNASGGSYTFGGNSLTKSGTSAYSAGMIFQSFGATPTTLTINNFTLSGAFQFCTDQGGTTQSHTAINGNVTLANAVTLNINDNNPNATIQFNAPITGSSLLTLRNTWQQGTAMNVINLAANNSGFTGGVNIQGGCGLVVSADGGLGSGNVNLSALGASLTLGGGTLNDYIGNSAELIVTTGDSVNLSYSGIDYVGSVLDGATLITSGTVGAVGSGATYTSSDFTGTGLLEIAPAPEPTTLALAGIGGLMVAVWRKKVFVS